MTHALTSILKCVEIKEQHIRDNPSFCNDETSDEMKIINGKNRCKIKALPTVFESDRIQKRQIVRLKLLKFKMVAHKNAIILCTTVTYYVNT
jgi:hypothetical protein